MDIEILDYYNGTFVPDGKDCQAVCLRIKNGLSLDLEEKLIFELMLSGI